MMKKWVARLLCVLMLLVWAPNALAYTYVDVFTPQTFAGVYNASLNTLLSMLYPNESEETIAMLTDMMTLEYSEELSEAEGTVGYVSKNRAMTMYYQCESPDVPATNVTVMIPEQVAQTYLIIYMHMISLMDEDCDAAELVQWVVNHESMNIALTSFEMQYNEFHGYTGVVLAPTR